MNLVIREVFPTLCSPRNTSLNFRKGFPKSPDVDMMVATLKTAFKTGIKKDLFLKDNHLLFT